MLEPRFLGNNVERLEMSAALELSKSGFVEGLDIEIHMSNESSVILCEVFELADGQENTWWVVGSVQECVSSDTR